MNKFRNLLDHLLIILSLMFLVFLVLDQFNPMMNFVQNSISQVLLAVLCCSAIARSILAWTRLAS